jgi:DNA-binding MarR family transcriptional regulator
VAIVRDVKSQVDEIKGLVGGLVCNRSVRDPLWDVHPDLTGPQMQVIATLGAMEASGEDASPPTMTLAQRTGCSGPTMTGLIDRLEKQGLVARERDEGDRRLVRVRLTDAGRQAFMLLDANFTERMSRVLEALEPDDRETFVRLTRIIVSALADNVHTEKSGS